METRAMPSGVILNALQFISSFFFLSNNNHFLSSSLISVSTLGCVFIHIRLCYNTLITSSRTVSHEVPTLEHEHPPLSTFKLWGLFSILGIFNDSVVHVHPQASSSSRIPPLCWPPDRLPFIYVFCAE